MSIHYLLDGYNVIHRMPSALKLAKLEDQRRQLIRFIEHYKPQGSLNNRVTVVFDGNVNVFGGMPSHTVKVVFSQQESADDRIKKIVAQAQNSKNIVVVSDDRDIQYAIRALGAKASSAQAFLNKAKGLQRQKFPEQKAIGKTKKSSKKNNSAGTKKHISKSVESKITSELGNIWLRQEKKRENRL